MAKSVNNLSFDEAFKRKRRELGPGETFMWQGKKYSTDRKDDSDDSMDDLTPRGNLPSSEDDVTEGGPTQRNSPRTRMKQSETPGRRFTGTYGETREALSSLSPEEKVDALKTGLNAAAAMVPAGRAVQGVKNAKRMYDIGKRVTAMPEAAQKTAFLRAARAAKEVDGMRGGGRVKKYAGGGSVSSASKRADGIATKGKTRGRMV